MSHGQRFAERVTGNRRYRLVCASADGLSSSAAFHASIAAGMFSIPLHQPMFHPFPSSQPQALRSLNEYSTTPRLNHPSALGWTCTLRAYSERAAGRSPASRCTVPASRWRMAVVRVGSEDESEEEEEAARGWGVRAPTAPRAFSAS